MDTLWAKMDILHKMSILAHKVSILAINPQKHWPYVQFLSNLYPVQKVLSLMTSQIGCIATIGVVYASYL